MGFQEFAQSLTISHLWFPKLIQRKLYSGYSVTLTTTHIIQIAETDSCRQHVTQDDAQSLPLAPNLPAVHGHSSMHHSLPKPKGLPCSSYQICYQVIFSPAFKILKVGVNYLPNLSAPPTEEDAH